MKVFIFIIEGIIIKHHKTSINITQARCADEALVDVYYRWNKMYLHSQQEYFLESDLEKFKVC